MNKKIVLFFFILLFIFNFSCKNINLFVKPSTTDNIQISYKYLDYNEIKNLYNINTTFYILSLEFIKNKTYSKFYNYLTFYDIKPFNKIKSKTKYYLNYLHLEIKLLNLTNQNESNIDNNSINNLDDETKINDKGNDTYNNDYEKNLINRNSIYIIKNDFFYKPLNGSQIEMLLVGQKNFINKKFINNLIEQNSKATIKFNNSIVIDLLFLSNSNFDISGAKLIIEINGKILDFDL